MKKLNQLGGKKNSIVEDMEKLKQRREDRKIKNEDDKKNEKKDDNNGKACDAYYENLIKKKKIAFNIEPENVFFFYFFTNIYKKIILFSMSQLTPQKYLLSYVKDLFLKKKL